MTPWEEEHKAQNNARLDQGIKLYLLANIEMPHLNHYISDDPGKHGGIFSQPIDEVRAEANAASAQWAFGVLHVAPYIQTAAEMLFNAAQKNPEEIRRLYEILYKGSLAGEAEQHEAQRIAQNILSEHVISAVPAPIDPSKEKAAVLGWENKVGNRRKFLSAIGGAGVTTAATVYAAGKAIDATFEEKFDLLKVAGYSGAMMGGFIATAALGLTALCLHDADEAEKAQAARLRDQARSGAVRETDQRIVEKMVFAAARALYELEKENIPVVPPVTPQRLM
jgi:hypothetical protein